VITVAEALARALALVAPLPAETVPLRAAAGRVLAAPMLASHDQPPFAASAMDGYAIAGPASPGTTFAVIGQSQAGKRYQGPVAAGQAVRIFTGAPVPEGAERVVLQEDVSVTGDRVRIDRAPEAATHIRAPGQDFRSGDRVEPRLLRPQDLALLAAMNHAAVPVIRRPVVAILATGDELVMPGTALGPDQIVCSNSFALAAMVQAAGAEARMLPIARDTEASMRTAFGLAEAADMIVTIGGASVGDHDLVGPVAESLGMERAFWKIAMRPGKPLMAGRLGNGCVLLGLPGNPVSSIVCGHLFLLPMIARMLGAADPALRPQMARLSEPLPANGPRAHYLRGVVDEAADGTRSIRALPRQDSSLLSVLTLANALLIQDIDSPALPEGASVPFLPL
jgi:molybdopterin molybdotransferase